MQKRFTNRLINESSPYLLQHAHNPVDWFAWGEEALLKARSEGKVILVSIGYSACHWCHVMERESFEDETVAKQMNEHFINIKIDREERPDLDHIYMDAIQAITGSGGWPLNVFLTPEGKPFFGGTYFPPVKAFNRSSWPEVLNGISQAWKERKNEIESQAENLTSHLLQANNFALKNNILSTGSDDQVTIQQCHSMYTAIMLSADKEWGGFGKAPKFPQTFTIQFLLQYHYFTGDPEALKQALLSIDKMLMGGIYDHVGGGLARYSTDNEWLAPHFEKMLYDNALFIIILCDAFQLTSAKKYAHAIRKTILFVTNELLNEEGGFYAALDADSEGEEGKYYVWRKDEVDKLLGKDSDLFCAFFDISEKGNWDEKNILRTIKTINNFIEEKGGDKEELEEAMQQGLAKLLLERNTRIKPALDDKIILGWNALMVKAVAKAAIVLQDDDYRKMATANFHFLLQSFKKGQDSAELMHTYKNGVAKYPAFLDDYAFFIAACIELYKVSLNDHYLETAVYYCKYVIGHFSDEEDVFFYFTHFGQKDIIIRKKEIYDGATPSGNSIMAGNLYYLSLIMDEPQWRKRADKMLETLTDSIIKYPGSFGIWASLLLNQVAGINEIAIIGADFESVSNKIMLNFIPNLVLMGSTTENPQYPLLKDKPDSEYTQIFLCKNYTCLAPFSAVNPLIQQINQDNKLTH